VVDLSLTFTRAETVEMLSFLRRLRRIDVSALTPGKRILLAEALQEAVEYRGREPVPQTWGET